jgi:hypothetical protein
MLSYVLDPVHVFFWTLVALLTMAAVGNHAWHHARDRHPTERLTRSPYPER